MSSSDLSRSPPSDLTVSQVSQEPHSCSQGFNDGHLLYNNNSYSVDDNLIVINPHAKTCYSEDPTAVEDHGESMEVLQEGEESQQNKSSDHILLQSNNGFTEVSHTADPGKTHYYKLTELMDYICDKVIAAQANNTCLPAMNDRVIKIQQNLRLPSKIYKTRADSDILETANQQVQQQYDELKNTLEELLCLRGLRNAIQIEEAHRKLSFQEYVGPYSSYNLIEIIKKINHNTTSQSQCTIL